MATVTTEKLTYGIKNVYAAKITNTDGVITYGTPKAITGATEITLSAAGEEVKIYADDAAYFVTSVNGGYTGNLNTYTLPDWFYTDFLGYIADAKVIRDNLRAATPRRRPDMYKRWKIKKYKGERYVGNDAMVQGKKGEIPLSNILEFSTKHGHPFIRETYERSINEAVQAVINDLKKEL